MDPRALALEWIESRAAKTDVPGRLVDDGAHGAALIAVALMGQGVTVDIGFWDGLPDIGTGKFAIASHVVAIDDAAIARAVRFVETGGHLVLDATTAHKTFDASLWRPWPGGLAEEFDMRVEGLESDPRGWEVRFGTFGTARLIAARSRLQLRGTGWTVVPGLRFAQDNTPLAVTQVFGAGRVTLCRCLIGPSLVHNEPARPVISALLDVLLGNDRPVLRPAFHEPGIWSSAISTSGGDLTLVVAPSAMDRQGKAVSVTAPRGRYVCYWSGETHITDSVGELSLPMSEGIALLFREGE